MKFNELIQNYRVFTKKNKKTRNPYNLFLGGNYIKGVWTVVYGRMTKEAHKKYGSSTSIKFITWPNGDVHAFVVPDHQIGSTDVGVITDFPVEFLPYIKNRSKDA